MFRKIKLEVLIIKIVQSSNKSSNTFPKYELIASILFIFTLVQSKEKYVRLLIFGNLTSWIIYDFFVKAYLAGISDLFVISSTITAIIRYDIKKEVK